MADGEFSRDDAADARSSPRFVPKDRLSMFLAGTSSSLVHGDVKDLSEMGACLRTDTALENGCVVTINVKSGYSFLFRAEGRVVWRAEQRRPEESYDCSHGVLFTGLSSFTKKLIRRLGGFETSSPQPPDDAPIEGVVWDSDSDPDLEILFRAERSPADMDDDRLDAIADPLLEAPLPTEPVSSVDLPALDGEAVALAEPAEIGDPYLDTAPAKSEESRETIEWRDAAVTALAPKLSEIQARPPYEGDVELSGNLGYFDNTDVLQMLEATRATGVLYVEGPVTGTIHIIEGRICRCVSEGYTEEEAAFHLVVARQGRFHFVPCPVPDNARGVRTTTQMVLEAQLKRDRDR